MSSASSSRARRKKKSVRMSVDFGESGGGETGAAAGAVAAGAADPEEVQILLPREEEEEGRAGFSNGGGRVPGVSSGAGGGGGNTALLQTQERGPLDAQMSFSENDPALVLAASIFVDELILQAALEVDRRMGAAASKEEQAFLFGKYQRGKLGLDDAKMDENFRFIRREINKKCRRVYQVLLSCYGKMP